MRQRIDEQLVREIADYELRFTCEHCAHRIPGYGCAHDWPSADHERAPDAHSIGKELVFCKEFDLG
jgi:hypothetical protein